MITMGILDFISQWVAGLVSLIPALPSQWTTVVGQVNTGEAWLSNELGLFGSIVPWSATTTCLLLWSGLVGFWLLMMGVRLVLWLANR